MSDVTQIIFHFSFRLPIGVMESWRGWAAFLAVSFCAAAAVLSFWTLRRFYKQRDRANELSENLQRSEMESRRRMSFLNAISHDLRTPLNGISLQTHIIERAVPYGDESAWRDAIADIRGSCALAEDILASLLQYARSEVAKNMVTRVSLKELVQDVAEPFRAAAEEKNLSFHLYLSNHVMISTDPEKMKRVLANLLDNALKFTAQGSITVTVEASPEEPGLHIEVKDTGEGILPEDQPRLFSEFFQANNPSRDARLGLGLGLVVARRLTEQLGGTLVCTSEHGRGSTFCVRLPAQVVDEVEISHGFRAHSRAVASFL